LIVCLAALWMVSQHGLDPLPWRWAWLADVPVHRGLGTYTSPALVPPSPTTPPAYRAPDALPTAPPVPLGDFLTSRLPAATLARWQDLVRRHTVDGLFVFTVVRLESLDVSAPHNHRQGGGGRRSGPPFCIGAGTSAQPTYVHWVNTWLQSLEHGLSPRHRSKRLLLGVRQITCDTLALLRIDGCVVDPALDVWSGAPGAMRDGLPHRPDTVNSKCVRGVVPCRRGVAGYCARMAADHAAVGVWHCVCMRTGATPCPPVRVCSA
jgi:hypothetical protein